MSAGALAKRGLLLAITGVSLYLLAPALLEVFGAFDELDDISPLWFVAMIVLQIGSYACMWGIQKIAVRARALGAGDHLAARAERLRARRAGRRGGSRARCSTRCSCAPACRPAAAASGMTASSLLVFGTLLALPLLACRRSSPASRSTRASRARRRPARSSSC